MQPFRWEMIGNQTYPLEYLGNIYQIKVEETIVQFFENERKILEENWSHPSSQLHPLKEEEREGQILQWGRIVLETFLKECGICAQQKISFPLHLSQAPPEEAAFSRSKGIETICPHCVDLLHQQAQDKNIRIKQAFLRGEVKVFGGTDEELLELLQSPTGALIQQFASVVYPNWNLGAIRFSDNRLYLALILVNSEDVETFAVLVETQAKQITSMRPDTALTSLGFQEGDNLQFLSFQ